MGVKTRKLKGRRVCRPGNSDGNRLLKVCGAVYTQRATAAVSTDPACIVVVGWSRASQAGETLRLTARSCPDYKTVGALDSLIVIIIIIIILYLLFVRTHCLSGCISATSCTWKSVTTFGGHLCSSTMWVLETTARPSGLVANTLTRDAILLA